MNKSYQPIDKINVIFTARLMAHYRAKEMQRDLPLIQDPYAEQLAGNLETFLSKNLRYTEMDYPIIRSYYIEETLLNRWCLSNPNSQIIQLGAGLDTRIFRYSALKGTQITMYEVDQAENISYKKIILENVSPLCPVKYIGANLVEKDWWLDLFAQGFSKTLPTFWILEGLIYYLERFDVIDLFSKMALNSASRSQFFADICVPAIADIKVGPFSRHMKWGLNFNEITPFYESTGWNVRCSFADQHDQGRDVGQKGMIFIEGIKE